jgi:hypothetical protein
MTLDTPEPLTVAQAREALIRTLWVLPDRKSTLNAALDTLIAAARREGAQQALEDVAHEITLGIQGERHQRTGLNPPFHKDRYFLEGMRAAREIVTDVIHRRASLPLETPNP